MPGATCKQGRRMKLQWQLIEPRCTALLQHERGVVVLPQEGRFRALRGSLKCIRRGADRQKEEILSTGTTNVGNGDAAI